MAVPKDVRMVGSQIPLSYPAASRLAFGAAVVGSGLTAGSETIKAATSETSILGFADKRKFVRSGGYDGFYEQYEEVAIVDDFARALVTPNGADVNIDMSDFLEVAALGDGSTSPHGILEESGSATGGTFTVATVAKALESVTMGSKSYKVPANDVAISDKTVTMDAGAIAAMGLEVGDHVLLEDLNGACQVNKVASLTATVIGLVIPSTVALVHNNSDLVTRLYQCRVKVVK
jgi:hypothetical protein